MNDLPATESFSAFARRLGVAPSYVTQLRHDDRLVLTGDGKAVQVAESLARIDATRDPAKQGVADRHAAARAAVSAPAPAQAPAPAPNPPESPPVGSTESPEPAATSEFQHWREREQRAKALAAERANDLADGKLLVAEEVCSVVTAIITTLRTQNERLVESLAPQLVAQPDETRLRAILIEAVEASHADCARALRTLAKEPSP